MIKRMQIPRQLYNEGGISSVPLRRENFGLGSKFKKFVRKIIPKEVAQVAVKAAPFVAPFNPAIAGAMSGLGSFQQTGRIGSSLGRGALTYGGGQAARYLGGAGFQGAPQFMGGQGLGGNFGFSSPFGTDTGLGKFLSDRRVARQGINIDKGRGSALGDMYRTPPGQPSVISQSPMGDTMWSGQPERWSPGIQHSGAPQFPNQPPPSILSQRPSVISKGPMADDMWSVSPEQRLKRITAEAVRPSAGGGADFMEADTFTKALPKGVAETASEAIDKGPSIWEKVKTLNPLSKDFDFTKAGNTITDLGGKALSAVFRKEDGSLDKTAILAALVTVPTFFEARALADEAGLGADEFTEEMFTAAKADSKKTYESNLGSFFEGTGYTGNLAKGGLIRRNYAFGPDPDEFPEDDDLTIFEIIKEQGIPVGEQVRDKKIDVGATSIQLAKVTDKQRQQMQHDIPYLTSGATDLQTVYENTKAWDDEGSKGFWGMGKKEAEPMTKEEFQEEMIKRGYLNIKNKSIEDFDRLKIKKGGRIGFDSGGNEEGLGFIHRDKIRKAYNIAEKSAEAEDINIDDEMEGTFSSFFKNKRIRKALIDEGHNPDKIMRELLVEQMKSETGEGRYLPQLDEELQGYSDLFRKGGRVKYALGTPPVSEGGLGGLPVEADMRYTGGFMPYGEKEKGDDVPARLSKNEFVFTADAVRAAGGGSMQKGAQRMYNTMKMLEGQVA